MVELIGLGDCLIAHENFRRLTLRVIWLVNRVDETILHSEESTVFQGKMAAEADGQVHLKYTEFVCSSYVQDTNRTPRMGGVRSLQVMKNKNKQNP